jgi:hypothetical protein
LRNELTTLSELGGTLATLSYEGLRYLADRLLVDEFAVRHAPPPVLAQTSASPPVARPDPSLQRRSAELANYLVQERQKA